MTDRNDDNRNDAIRAKDPAGTPDPALERRILAALELPVPELSMPDLPAIEADKVTVLPTKKRIGTPVWLGLAATVVVAAMLGVRLFDASVTYPSLADEIIAHLDHEPHALRPTDEPVSDRRLGRVDDHPDARRKNRRRPVVGRSEHQRRNPAGRQRQHRNHRPGRRTPGTNRTQCSEFGEVDQHLNDPLNR